MSNRGRLLVISGPSGSGKTSLAVRALQEIPGLIFSVSHTTRLPRQGEQEGEDYFFVTQPRFHEMVHQDEFLEHAEVYGNFYGTSRSFVESQLAKGRNLLLDIDVQGGRQVKAAFPEAVLVFVFPPSREELERRLRDRGLDDGEAILRRLKTAAEEIRSYQVYDYIIINEDIDESFAELKTVIEGGDGLRHLERENRRERAEEINQTFGEVKKK